MRGTDPLAYRAETGKPVYVPPLLLDRLEKRAQPASPTDLRKFPIDTLTERFGRYLNNSFSLLTVFAVVEGATEIWLDGVLYSEQSPAELWSVPCIDHALGIAKGAGVTVKVPPGSGLLGNYYGAQLYGYEGPGSI